MIVGWVHKPVHKYLARVKVQKAQDLDIHYDDLEYVDLLLWGWEGGVSGCQRPQARQN